MRYASHLIKTFVKLDLFSGTSLPNMKMEEQTKRILKVYQSIEGVPKELAEIIVTYLPKLRTWCKLKSDHDDVFLEEDNTIASLLNRRGYKILLSCQPLKDTVGECHIVVDALWSVDACHLYNWVFVIGLVEPSSTLETLRNIILMQDQPDHPHLMSTFEYACAKQSITKQQMVVRIGWDLSHKFLYYAPYPSLEPQRLEITHDVSKWKLFVAGCGIRVSLVEWN